MTTRNYNGEPSFSKLPKYNHTTIYFILLFIILYIFFRFANPIVIWDGDDWHTNNFGTQYIFGNLFHWNVGTLQSSNIFSNLLGTLFGYIAGFIIYPLNGDYIAAYITVDAFARALFVALSLFLLWKELKILLHSNFLAIIGTFVFLVSAFTYMKTGNTSEYLYWSYNRCAIYYYCIPSYLAGAFSLYLIRRHVMGDEFKLQQSAWWIVCLYFLIFSFFPAATMVAVTTFVILLFSVCKNKKISTTLKQNWFHCLALILYLIKTILELTRIFSSGYFKPSQALFDDLMTSFKVLSSSFAEMHSLFKLLLLLGIFFAFDAFIARWSRKEINDDDRQWLMLMSEIAVMSLIMFLFYVAFGSSALYSHIYDNNLFRMDTLYAFYFLLLLIVSLSWAYVFKTKKKITVCLPLLLCMMITVVISPENPFSVSTYDDSSAKQKYEIMSSVVEKAEVVDRAGGRGLVVHMPPYSHYDFGWMGTSMQYHNITSSNVAIQFVYDAVDDIWFE